MDNDMDELVSEFLVESFENLDRLDQDLVVLEASPGDLEVLRSIFRTIHTIKGTCGFLGYATLESIAHVGENLLSLLRDGVGTVDAEIATALLGMTDAVRAILVEIEQTGSEGENDYAALVATLAALEQRVQSNGGSASEANGETTYIANAPSPDNDVIADVYDFGDEVDGAAVAGADHVAGVIDDDLDDDDDDGEPPELPKMGALLVERAGVSPVDVAVGLLQQQAGDVRPLGEILVESGAVGSEQVERVLAEQARVRGSVADASLRVDVGLLDEVMTLVGELVLARNQILQFAGLEGVGPAFGSATQRLNVITTELQAGVMKTRMQPIGNVWSKFPRVVRDLAQQFGKRARIEMAGKDTELDKTIIEAIKDPLTHIVRNSIDHGLETPAARVAAGKPEEGVLVLRAFHEGGQVNIEISDDGAGIDVERVKQKAVARGLVSVEAAARMGEREAANLIFLPGLSTAERVSNVSGRGVGMDVVRTNIEQIGGSLDLSSRKGEGTTIKVKIPLTLAIVPALIVGSGGQRYAIPQVSLLELVGLDAAAAQIELVHGAPVYRLRGQILPIVSLHQELGLPEPVAGSPVTIVVLKADDRQFGLVVEQVNDTEEIVVKPLSAHCKNISAFSGCTIMGDGHVALILDTLGLAQRARVVTGKHDHAGAVERVSPGTSDAAATETSLVVRVGAENRCAIPLRVVDRLEEFARDKIEHTADTAVVQYRDTILPLVDIANVLGFPPAADTSSDTVQVVVYSDGTQMVGFVVERIIDIVEHTTVIQHASDRECVLGSLVVDGSVTDLLDMHQIVQAVAGRDTDREAVGA